MDLLCFGSDWQGHPSSAHHLVRHLDYRRALWVNSLGMRTPSLSRHDVSRLLYRAGRLLRHALPRAQASRLWALDPLYVPLQQSELVQAGNRLLLGRQLKWSLRWLGIDPSAASTVVLTMLPNSVDLIAAMKPGLCVYYCLDDYEQMPGVDQEVILAQEKRLVQSADLVVVTAEKLLHKWEPHAKEILWLPHGVDLDAFAKPGPVPAALAEIPSPRIGFFGTLDHWIDLDLIAAVARLRPDWQFPIVGPTRVPVTALEGLPNVQLLGAVPFSEIPGCAAGFDVGLLPFVVNDFTMSVNPLKLREYFAAGIPAVSTGLAEVEAYQPLARIGNSPEAFVEAIAAQLAAPPSSEALRDAVVSDSWAARADTFCEGLGELTRFPRQALS